MTKVSVIGSGTWGMALALLLSDNGHEVTVWSAIPAEIEELKTKHEHRTLPGVIFPDSMKFTTDLKEAMHGKEILVLSVPSIYTRSTAAKMKPYYDPKQIIVSVAKGIEEKTLKTLTEQFEEEIPGAELSVLCGPSHAEEVSKRVPTTCVVGAKRKVTAKFVQSVFLSPVFRVYISPDVLGMELGGAVKNVIALAAGIADGLGYGDNTKAALITRGIAEIKRLGVKMGASPETFSGLTGIGDLIVTCASMHSRNRRAGILIGQGKTMEEAMKEVNQVVEGVYSAKAARKLADTYGVEMPIVAEVNRILFEGKPARQAVEDLMQRDPIAEDKSLKWEI
jgi:glycerol-3-phosphate dehydrogenase (NAD(P)+)